MSDKSDKGIMRKFKVERLTPSSRGINHDHCHYFVLDIDHDPHARTAASAYAESCETEYPNLAADLRGMVKRPVRAANVLPTLAANDAENEALRAEVASLRAFQSEPRAD